MEAAGAAVAKGRRAARTTRAQRVRSRAAAVAASPAEGQAKSAARTAPAPARTSAAPVGRVNSAEERVSLAASAGNATIQRTSAGLTTLALCAADPDRRVVLTTPAPTAVAASRTVPPAWRRARRAQHRRVPATTALVEPVEGSVNLVATTEWIAPRHGPSARPASATSAVEPVSLAAQDQLSTPACRASRAEAASVIRRTMRGKVVHNGKANTGIGGVYRARAVCVGPCEYG